MKNGINERIIMRHPDWRKNIRKLTISPTKMKQSLNSHLHKQKMCAIVVERKDIYPLDAKERINQWQNGISTEIRKYKIYNKSWVQKIQIMKQLDIFLVHHQHPPIQKTEILCSGKQKNKWLQSDILVWSYRRGKWIPTWKIVSYWIINGQFIIFANGYKHV